MSTSAHGNHSQPPNGGGGGAGGRFEEGFSIEDAERLAATFRPSWELDDAPFAAGGMDAREMAELSAGGVNSEVRANTDSSRSQVAAAHAPAPRTETHEPEVSIIIDRTITADDVATAPPAPAHIPSSAIAQGHPAVDAQMAASVTRPRAAVPPTPRARVSSSTDGFEYRVKKSNKGLFIGIGVAVLAAAAVLGIRAMTASPEVTTVTPAVPTSLATNTGPAFPAPPPASAVATNTKPAAASAPLNIPSQPLPPPQPARAPRATPKPAAPPHHSPAASPKNPPKSGNGGIVRDVPF